MSARKLRFATIGIDHNHGYFQVDQLTAAGCELVSFWATDPAQIARFTKTYPQATLARSTDEIMEDESIELINCAAIPSERAAIGIAAMRHGKDFLVDKPGLTTLDQFAEVKRVQAETKRFYSIWFGERLDEKATVKAGELVQAGAIGKVIQTIGIGPHQLTLTPRPWWFFEKAKYGGILIDIGSHQFDQFLFFTGSTEAEVVCAQVGNFNHPEHPELEDFGDVVVRGNGGVGYTRLDWFTPDGLGTWGDVRLLVLGTDGYIEVRKNVDVAGRAGGEHLFLVDKHGTQYIDCRNVELPFGKQLINDIHDRTETAMTQAHVFLAAELGLKADAMATRLGYLSAQTATAA